MVTADLTDGKLLKGCISGDKEEWDSFIQRYNKLIYHTIYKTLRVNGTPTNPDDVNDLFQEVFTSFCADNFKKLRLFNPTKGCSLPSWLRMITVRMTIDHLRKDRLFTSIDELTREPAQAGDQEAIVDRENLNYIREMLEELPVKDKLLIELSYVRELSPEEIAQILHISIEAFYTRKSRIIDKLKKIAADRKVL